VETFQRIDECHAYTHSSLEYFALPKLRVSKRRHSANTLLNLDISGCFIVWLLSLCPRRDIVDCLILGISITYSGHFWYLHE
jgi:hypothetical protein